MADMLHAYVPLTKQKTPEGHYIVRGIATDDTLDLDKQICDPEWLATAMPDWFKNRSNIRVMHQPVAAGQAFELGQKGTGWEIQAKIVDADAITKLENGVYRGFSIGISDYKLDKSSAALKRAPKGIINGGFIPEISLVDVPANPNAKLELAKMADGVLEKTQVVADGCPPCDVCNGFGEVLKDGAMATCPECDGTGEGAMPNIRPSENGGDEEEGVLGEKRASCTTCKGIGAVVEKDEKGHYTGNVAKCPDCSGLSQFGKMADGKEKCGLCDGTGKIRDGHVKCPDCDGTGEVDKSVEGELNKTPMSTAKQNDLPDSDFAYIEPGGTKDDEGKTTPRSKRHFPINDAAHVRNALARASQSPFGDKAMPKIKAAAKKFGVEVSDKALSPELLKVVQSLQKVADEPMTHDPAQLASVRSGFISLINQELAEMDSGKESEISDVQQLLSALSQFLDWWQDEADNDETTDPFLESTGGIMATFFGLELDAELHKAATADGASDTEREAFKSHVLEKLGISALKTTADEALEKASGLEERLSKVEQMSAPRGIALRQQEEQREIANKRAQLTEDMNAYLSLAGTEGFDSSTRQEYRKSAANIAEQLEKLPH